MTKITRAVECFPWLQNGHSPKNFGKKRRKGEEDLGRLHTDVTGLDVRRFSFTFRGLDLPSPEVFASLDSVLRAFHSDLRPPFAVLRSPAYDREI